MSCRKKENLKWPKGKKKSGIVMLLLSFHLSIHSVLYRRLTVLVFSFLNGMGHPSACLISDPFTHLKWHSMRPKHHFMRWWSGKRWDGAVWEDDHDTWWSFFQSDLLTAGFLKIHGRIRSLFLSFFSLLTKWKADVKKEMNGNARKKEEHDFHLHQLVVSRDYSFISHAWREWVQQKGGWYIWRSTIWNEKKRF